MIQEDFCGPIGGFSKDINSTKDRLFGPLCILEYDCFLNLSYPLISVVPLLHSTYDDDNLNMIFFSGWRIC